MMKRTTASSSRVNPASAGGLPGFRARALESGHTRSELAGVDIGVLAFTAFYAVRTERFQNVTVAVALIKIWIAPGVERQPRNVAALFVVLGPPAAAWGSHQGLHPLVGGGVGAAVHVVAIECGLQTGDIGHGLGAFGLVGGAAQIL